MDAPAGRSWNQRWVSVLILPFYFIRLFDQLLSRLAGSQEYDFNRLKRWNRNLSGPSVHSSVAFLLCLFAQPCSRLLYLFFKNFSSSREQKK